MIKRINGNIKQCVLPQFLALKGYETNIGVNDVVVLKQDDGSLKASPLQIYFKVTSNIRSAIVTQKPKVCKIQIRENEFIECMNIDCSDLQCEETEHTCKLSNEQLHEMKLDAGINPAFFIIEEINVRIPFFIYQFDQGDKLIVTDIDGTITKSDGRGFFGGNLGCKVHHESVHEFFQKAHENGYKIIYLTARPIKYHALTRKYLFETLKDSDVDIWRLPQNPVFCLSTDIAEAILRDSALGASGKTTPLTNLLSLFKETSSTVVVGAYGNNDSDSEAYKNVGIPISNTFMIDTNSRIVNLATQEETSFKLQASEIDTLYPKY